ncbi:MAG TPA: DUF4230 domain-containing protein [Candidatus Acidoferrum sp.]|nr:DUF4230 domain-containing protein [Candidatus Acidoferrum sp.]
MSAEPNASSHLPPPHRAGAWAWPVAWMVTVLLLVLAALYVFRSCRAMPGEALERASRLAKGLADVASAFNQGTITTTFTSYATTLKGSEYLQFATITEQERFQRTDEASTAFGYIPLPDVIVEAEAPVTYTYYLDLNDKWEFALKDNTITVTAPHIRFNKPAVDASGIRFEVKKDSIIRDTQAALEELKASITWMVNQKARQNISLVRETGRKETQAFVETWLAKSFADGRKYAVTVRFRDETSAHGAGPVLNDR